MSPIELLTPCLRPWRDDDLPAFAALAVMERIGMQRDPDGDFEHPGLPPDHPLRLHVLHRLGRAEWEALR